MNQSVVPVLTTRPIQRPYILQNPNLMWLRKDHDRRGEFVHNESRDWLRDALPLWSRLNKRNSTGKYRSLTTTKIRNYDIEIEGMLYSLWGNLHPKRDVFDKKSRDKQYIACCVLALCASRIYSVGAWTPQILDSTVVNGDRYYIQSVSMKKGKNHSLLTVNDLNAECWLDAIRFRVHIELVAHGKLYCRPSIRQMNLAEALMHFFGHFQLGLLQCQKRCLAFGFVPGPEGGYFLYDCQSWEMPLFTRRHGSSYVLLAKNIQLLLYCLVVALNISTFHQPFTIHSVELDSEFCDPLYVGKLKE